MHVENLIPLNELAKRLGVSGSYVRRKCAEGLVGAIKLNGNWFVPKDTNIEVGVRQGRPKGKLGSKVYSDDEINSKANFIDKAKTLWNQEYKKLYSKTTDKRFYMGIELRAETESGYRTIITLNSGDLETARKASGRVIKYLRGKGLGTRFDGGV